MPESVPRPATLLKKETLAQVFSYEVCKISKNTFFTEHIWATASAHVMNLLLFIILESVNMIFVLICCKNMTIIFSKSVSSSLFVQIVSYCIGKKHLNKYFIRQYYLLRYIRSKSGRKLVLDATVVCSRDLNLRTNYFSIVSFHLFTLETRHSRHGIGKVWET